VPSGHQHSNVNFLIIKENSTVIFMIRVEKKCNVDSITQNCHIIGLVNITSIWFVNNRFGVSWQLKQLQVFQPPKYDTYLITGTDPVEEENEKAASTNSTRSRSRSPRELQLPED
jgi:hypothetical protein